MRINSRAFLSTTCAAVLATAFALQERGVQLQLSAIEKRRAYIDYTQRDVVREFGITSARFEDGTVTIDGYLVKRGCRLNSSDPYAAVDFWREHPDGSRDRVPFSFANRPAGETPTAPASRPEGASSYLGWSIILGPTAGLDDVVVAFAQHNCGTDIYGQPIIIGPREFARFTPREALTGKYVWRTQNGE